MVSSFCDTLGCSVCMCVGGWDETLTPLFTSFSFLRAGISPSMEIDSLDPIPCSSTGADTFVFALREMVVRLLRAILVDGENNVPNELSSCEASSFFFGLPILSWLLLVCARHFFRSFFVFVSFSFVRFLGMLVEVVAVVAIDFELKISSSTQSTSCSDSFVVQKMLLLCYFRCSRCLRYLCFLLPEPPLLGCPLNRERNRTEITGRLSRVTISAVIRFAFFTREILLVRFRAVLIRPFLRGAFAGKCVLFFPFPISHHYRGDSTSPTSSFPSVATSRLATLFQRTPSFRCLAVASSPTSNCSTTKLVFVVPYFLLRPRRCW